MVGESISFKVTLSPLAMAAAESTMLLLLEGIASLC